MSPKEDLYEWLLNNYELTIAEEVQKIVRAHGNDNGLEDYESDILSEEINDKLKQSLLNVANTYEEETNAN